MVWSLSPLNPSPGTYKYCFTSPGTYKVGRKDTAVVIQVDKTVSRLHAEIIIEPVTRWSVSEGLQNIPRAGIHLRDLSKFGTFVNKEVTSKPVFSLPDKEVTLKEGDVITFGTNISTFRLDFHLYLIHVPAFLEKCKKEAVIHAVNIIGGHVLEKWYDECTHLLVEDGSPVTETVIEAIIKKKPIISFGWIEAMACRATPAAEIPSLSRFAPTVGYKMLDSFTFFKIADSETRGLLFKGFTFIVGSLNTYESKGHLCSLIEVSGGNAVIISQRHLFQQVLNASICQKKAFLILPSEKVSLEKWLNLDDLKFVLHLPRTNEQKIVSAVLAGRIDCITLQIPASPTSSASTDETVGADADADVDGTEHGSQVMACSKQFGIEQELICSGRSPVQDAINTSSSSIVKLQGTVISSINSPDANNFTFVDKQAMLSQRRNINYDTQIDKNLIEGKTNVIPAFDQESKADIVFRDDLIVNRSRSGRDHPSIHDRVKNFKCFKRKQEVSGNSFDILVPFAKEPYRESDYAKEVKEYMLQERRLKEAETLAEELFNAEQLKRQKASVLGLPAKQGKLKSR